MNTYSRYSNVLKLGLLILIILVWLPFLWLSFYNVPIGMHEWDWMTREAGQLPLNWFDTQKVIYTEVMGRYTSNAVLSLTHIWCTLSSFRYFFLLWQFAWVVTLFYLVKHLFRPSSILLTVLTTFCIHVIYLTNLEDVYDSMYRYTGLLTYQLGFILACWALVLIIRAGNQEKGKHIIKLLAMLLLMLCIGTNEISMVLCGVTTGIIFLFEYRNRNKNRTFSHLDMLIILACCAIVILSPANSIRMDSEHGTLPIGKWMMTTLGATLYLWTDWLATSKLILISVLIMPLLARATLSSSSQLIFGNVKPWLYLLILYVPATMSMLLFATGSNAFPERVVDHLFIHVVIIWFGLLFALSNKYKLYTTVQQLQSNLIIKSAYWGVVLFVLFNIFGDGLSVNRNDTLNKDHYIELIRIRSDISNAWGILLNGDAKAYYNQSIEQLEMLKLCDTDTCICNKPKILPAQLYDAMSDRRNRGGDSYIGYYFNPKIRRVKYHNEK